MMITRLFAPFIIAAAGCAAFAGASQAQPAAFGGPKMLIHGNYCGPGNNAPLPPVDALDAACARHDACTPEGGLPSRACNLRLQHEAEMIARDPRSSEKERAMAGMVAMGATMMPTSPQSEPTMTGSIRTAPAATNVQQDDEGDDE
ncbi:hypothetical protein [Methylobacterium persicinum]|uniref:Phospholipase A2 n=1 Tax=Methylobacterium persicinum TaxID=374426 RepID=A0ABU0HN84_9HYPH|nr:hypothetical protein [Methylobacterium persicinum]MDQ0442949.1 hypothetical protein [Methylobacterium persicinum]GJE37303.1 hypothetical protein KHHGKMAE_1359 [Methylobacterium persicinum]